MLQNKTIAVFMDVDNCALSFDNYKNALEQIASMGKIASCKLYGVSDRRHREIISDANDNGYDVALAMRVKKRNSRVFDNRILVDVVEKVVSNKQVDAVAVVCAPADMVYLYRFLKKREVAVIALDNADEDSVKLVDEVLDLGQVQVLKFPSQKPSKTVDDILEEGVDHGVTVEEKNAKLQDEIARLRQENGIVLPQQGHVEEVVEQLEQSQVEDTCQQEQSLVEDIAQLSEQDLPQEQGDNQPAAEEVQEEAGVEECQEQPQHQPQEDALPQTEDQSAQQVADDEDQLISQIESLRANLSDDSNDEELIA
ncbi:MAG: NYN domain-containing protein, partial [Clostridia bacterium]|nr:NYN domain-containing protein [Clostridia bacterium]